MKRKNVKIGQLVKVKKTTQRHCDRIGLVGNIVGVEELDYKGDFTVEVEFNERDVYGSRYDWFNHKDIKLVTDVEELSYEN